MTNQNIIKTFKQYQKISGKKQKEFFRSFEKKMIYRTTKTENPQTTHKMVRQILNKLEAKI